MNNNVGYILGVAGIAGVIAGFATKNNYVKFSGFGLTLIGGTLVLRNTIKQNQLPAQTKTSTNDNKFYFNKKGELVLSENILNGNYEFFIESDKAIYPLKNGIPYEKISGDLDLIIRCVFAEMGGSKNSYNSLVLVAESIINRTKLANGMYDKADGTIKGVIFRGYDVAKRMTKRFAAPQEIYLSNKLELAEYLRVIKAVVSTYYDFRNIGNGVTHYDSMRANLRDNNPKYSKIILRIEHKGIEGLWKVLSD